MPHSPCPLYYYLSAVLGCSARLHCVCSRFDCTLLFIYIQLAVICSSCLVDFYSGSSCPRYQQRVAVPPGAWRSDPYRSGGRHERPRTFASGTFLERVDYFSCISPPPASGQLRQFMIGRKKNEKKKTTMKKGRRNATGEGRKE